MNMLEVSHLSISFGGLKAVNDLNIAIKKGQLYGLIGPNGAGKTTAFNLLTGVYKADTGSVLLDGKNIVGMNTIAINKAGIARTFQNIRLFKELSVLDNVKVGLHNQMGYSTIEGILRLPRYFKIEKKMNEKALELLEVMGLKDCAGFTAANLPYGKQRKLEIARALATNPKLLLLDEPAAGLNPSERSEFIKLLLRIHDEGVTLFFIEHNMDVVMSVSQNITVVNFGAKIAEGTPVEIQNHPEVIKAYLGERYQVKK